MNAMINDKELNDLLDAYAKAYRDPGILDSAERHEKALKAVANRIREKEVDPKDALIKEMREALNDYYEANKQGRINGTTLVRVLNALRISQPSALSELYPDQMP
jgi:hypothetical protein